MIRWFLSKTIREAVAFRKHVQRLLNAQRDLMSAEAVAALQLKINELNAAIAGKANNGAIRLKMDELSFAAEEKIKPYPNALWRENVEVLLVAIAVAMAIRTFFIQPFKIPTGSMQPTLFGVTSRPDFSRINPNPIYMTEDDVRQQAEEQYKLQKSIQIPSGLERFKQWIHGISYVQFTAPEDGSVEGLEPPWPGAFISLYQKIKFNGKWYTIWFPPDFGEANIGIRAGLHLERGRIYHKGDDVIKLQMHAGDHLFVDRLTYNFRKPKRGEIIVFATAGTAIQLQDQFYIKRLTVLPGEHVQIGDDRHMRINGVRIDATTPHFEGIYSFDPKEPPRKSEYSGHLNGNMAVKYGVYPGLGLAPYFPDEDTVYTNGPDSYMVFGDNTCDSSDSRAWGTVPTKNVIGKSFFVYWPITERFGWHNR